MKLVCRQLGVDKWPYKHRGERKGKLISAVRMNKTAIENSEASFLVGARLSDSDTDEHVFFSAAWYPHVTTSGIRSSDDCRSPVGAAGLRYTGN
eukprot:517262-Hanusia_phi.AAC.1